MRFNGVGEPSRLVSRPVYCCGRQLASLWPSRVPAQMTQARPERDVGTTQQNQTRRKCGTSQIREMETGVACLSPYRRPLLREGGSEREREKVNELPVYILSSTHGQHRRPVLDGPLLSCITSDHSVRRLARSNYKRLCLFLFPAEHVDWLADRRQMQTMPLSKHVGSYFRMCGRRLGLPTTICQRLVSMGG